MKFAGKGKLKIEITCMKARYKILIIFLQLFAFFSYIGCFVYLTYKADKELIFVDIPVKYTKDDITGKEYGITITGSRGNHTVRFESESFPDKEFEATYYMSLPYPQRSFSSIIESHPKNLLCYLEPDFRENQGKYIPFVYSGQREKSSVYYLNLVAYVKGKYIPLWVFFTFFNLLMCIYTEKIKTNILIVVMLLNGVFSVLT